MNLYLVSGSAPPFYPVGTGEAMELLRQKLDEKNVYYMNPALQN